MVADGTYPYSQAPMMHHSHLPPSALTGRRSHTTGGKGTPPYPTLPASMFSSPPPFQYDRADSSYGSTKDTDASSALYEDLSEADVADYYRYDDCPRMPAARSPLSPNAKPFLSSGYQHPSRGPPHAPYQQYPRPPAPGTPTTTPLSAMQGGSGRIPPQSGGRQQRGAPKRGGLQLGQPYAVHPGMFHGMGRLPMSQLATPTATYQTRQGPPAPSGVSGYPPSAAPRQRGVYTCPPSRPHPMHASTALPGHSEGYHAQEAKVGSTTRPAASFAQYPQQRGFLPRGRGAGGRGSPAQSPASSTLTSQGSWKHDPYASSQDHDTVPSDWDVGRRKYLSPPPEDDDDEPPRSNSSSATMTRDTESVEGTEERGTEERDMKAGEEVKTLSTVAGTEDVGGGREEERGEEVKEEEEEEEAEAEEVVKEEEVEVVKEADVERTPPTEEPAALEPAYDPSFPPLSALETMEPQKKKKSRKEAVVEAPPPPPPPSKDEVRETGKAIPIPHSDFCWVCGLEFSTIAKRDIGGHIRKCNEQRKETLRVAKSEGRRVANNGFTKEPPAEALEAIQQQRALRQHDEQSRKEKKGKWTVSPLVQKGLDQTQSLLEAKQYKEALGKVQGLVPTNAREEAEVAILHGRALRHLEKASLDKAAACFEQALLLARDAPDMALTVLLELGAVHQERGSLQATFQHLVAAARIALSRDTLPTASLPLARAITHFAKQGKSLFPDQLALAVEVLTSAQAKAPSAEGAQALALCYERLENWGSVSKLKGTLSGPAFEQLFCAAAAAEGCEKGVVSLRKKLQEVRQKKDGRGKELSLGNTVVWSLLKLDRAAEAVGVAKEVLERTKASQAAREYQHLRVLHVHALARSGVDEEEITSLCQKNQIPKVRVHDDIPYPHRTSAAHEPQMVPLPLPGSLHSLCEEWDLSKPQCKTRSTPRSC